MIRSYDRGDAAALAAIVTTLFPQKRLSAAGFHSYLAAALHGHGRAWTMLDEDGPTGYAAVFPVPGLPHMVDLECMIMPQRQRQGLGSALLGQAIADLRTTAVRQVTYQVDTLDSPAARFLMRNGFTVEHEEWQLRRQNLDDLPRPTLPADVYIATRSREQAIPLLLRLYEASFSGLPWDQPYSAAEVAALLREPEDILFLQRGDEQIGFAWLQMERDEIGVIEPLGIVRGRQGQGYGRILLQTAVRELARRGAARAQIGAWRENEAAIGLYTSLGFAHYQTTTYLTYDL